MRYILGGLLLAGSTLAPSAPQGPGIGKDMPASKPASRVDTNTQEAIDFVDPGNGTATGFAAAIGISVGEATSRLRAQARLAKVIAELSAAHPDDFAGLKLEQKGGFKIHALFKGTADHRSEIASLATQHGVGHAIDQASAALSKRDRKGFGDRFIAGARGAKKRAIFSVDEESGNVVIGGPEDAALRKAAEAAAGGLPIKITFNPALGIVETNYAIAGDEFNGDGSTAEANGCTTGFSVFNGTYGTSTAAHCQNSPAEFNIYTNTSYGSGDALTFNDEFKIGTDVQWHGIGLASDESAPYYWNGVQSIAISSSYQTAIPSGYGMCKYGRTTGWTCGTTGDTLQDSNYGNGTFYSVSSNTDMTLEGDSGGPVVNGQTAYGWVHGRGTTHPYVMYYTAIQDVYAFTPLRITVCLQPC